MANRVEVYKPYIGSGKVYIRDASLPDGPNYFIGEVSELKLSIDEEVKKLASHTDSGGGTHAEVRRIDSVTASMVLHDLNADNIALATKGVRTSVEAGTVSDEEVTAFSGALIRLANPATSAVVVTSEDGTTTYTEGTDYEVRNEGLFVVDGGAISVAVEALATPSDGLPLLVSYSHSAYSLVEPLTASSTNWAITFGGMNEADSDNACVVDLHKVSLGAASEHSLIADDFGQLALEGTLQKDTSKGSSQSAYYRVQQV
jgi:hypothetical protein